MTVFLKLSIIFLASSKVKSLIDFTNLTNSSMFFLGSSLNLFIVDTNSLKAFDTFSIPF